MFVNYSVVTGVSVNPYRNNGYANSDVGGLVDDMVNGVDGNCPLEGTMEALMDGEYWQNSNATAEILEEVFEAIIKYHESQVA